MKIQIQNLRGDIVAQSATDGTLSNVSRVDEFGVPKSALPAGVKYAFHGSKQREAITAAGIVLMGARVYEPIMGRFLQADPVLGGTANPYEYPSDPVNQNDLTGQWITFGQFMYKASHAINSVVANSWRYVTQAGKAALKKLFKLGIKIATGIIGELEIGCASALLAATIFRDARRGDYTLAFETYLPAPVMGSNLAIDMLFGNRKQMKFFQDAAKICVGVPWAFVKQVFARATEEGKGK